MIDVAQDVSFMKVALRLAAKGRGRTSPNPMVGAVIVKQGRIVGEGYHCQVGGPHAEILALHKAGPRARGATMYVTLEPCCHSQKRTPPCVPALIHSHITRIVVATYDPNVQVRGKGVRRLQQAGITVEVGCLDKQAKELNEIYNHWIKTGRPFVILKAAMTVDGKVATARGESKWITGEKARQHVHKIRSQVDAIMVGIGTVLKDDPRLTARVQQGLKRGSMVRQPLRVVMDSQLRIPLSGQVLRWSIEHPTIIATTRLAPTNKIRQLKERGITVWILPRIKGQASLDACLKRLGEMSVTSVLLEGGSMLNSTALHERVVNKMMLYVSPRLLGGQDAKGLVGGRSPRTLSDAILVKGMHIRPLGPDYLFVGSLPSPDEP